MPFKGGVKAGITIGRFRLVSIWNDSGTWKITLPYVMFCFYVCTGSVYKPIKRSTSDESI